ncbi:MAG: hypothetical protein JWN04_3861 [Myxococcaceae bacterium]|nr:hypothetical protein [Myxococcaceae bacterium]
MAWWAPSLLKNMSNTSEVGPAASPSGLSWGRSGSASLRHSYGSTERELDSCRLCYRRIPRAQSTDRGWNGLEGILLNQLGHDLLRGDLFLFTGKDRRRAEVLLFDGTGLCIYMKRMSGGRFTKLRNVNGELRMTRGELALYLEGSELVARETLSPPALRLKDLARFDRS